MRSRNQCILYQLGRKLCLAGGNNENLFSSLTIFGYTKYRFPATSNSETQKRLTQLIIYFTSTFSMIAYLGFNRRPYNFHYSSVMKAIFQWTETSTYIATSFRCLGNFFISVVASDTQGELLDFWKGSANVLIWGLVGEIMRSEISSSQMLLSVVWNVGYARLFGI